MQLCGWTPKTPLYRMRLWGGRFVVCSAVVHELVVTSWLITVTSGLSAVMYWLAVSVVGLAAPEPPSQVSAGISTSCVNSHSGLYSISGSKLTPRPPRARDLVTMAEDGPAPGRVTAGVGSVSRGAGTESDLPDRSVQPTSRFGSESITITGNYWQFIYWLRKICADCRS